ncbi:MAG: hypothetical protein K2N16_04575 [Muribaculaceae bacterium]|nr:hypothetical protein [Muribaculaceae bacterium]
MNTTSHNNVNPYYNGQVQPVQPQTKKTIGAIIWDKTWRLIAAILLFGLAFLFGWLIYSFLGSGGGVVKIGGLFAPIIFAWLGIKLLIGFFKHLLKKQ